MKAHLAQELDKRLAVDMPPIRTIGADGKAPGYDVILSKFHNPFELTEVMQSCGFKDAKIHWYHYHPAPPMLEKALGPAFRKAAMALESTRDRGAVTSSCSAGVIEAAEGLIARREPSLNELKGEPERRSDAFLLRPQPVGELQLHLMEGRSG